MKHPTVWEVEALNGAIKLLSRLAKANNGNGSTNLRQARDSCKEISKAWTEQLVVNAAKVLLFGSGRPAKARKRRAG